MHEINSALVRVIPFAIVPVVFGILLKKGKISADLIALQRPASNRYFMLWLTGFLLLTLAIEYLLAGFGLLEIDKWNHASYAGSAIRIFGAVVLAPISEELLFRGMMLGKLLQSKKVSLPAAIAIQAIVFVALHNFTWQHSTSSYIGIAQGLLDASLFALARIRTGSLATSIGMHTTGNLIATLERFTRLAT